MPRYAPRFPPLPPLPPNQPMLLSSDLREWLPLDPLAGTLSELVDTLDYSAFYASYTGQGLGILPSEPALMVKALVCGHATGVLSSRQLARNL